MQGDLTQAERVMAVHWRMNHAFLESDEPNDAMVGLLVASYCWPTEMTDVGLRTAEVRREFDLVLGVAAKKLELSEGEGIDMANCASTLRELWSMGMRDWFRAIRPAPPRFDQSD